MSRTRNLPEGVNGGLKSRRCLGNKGLRDAAAVFQTETAFCREGDS